MCFTPLQAIVHGHSLSCDFHFIHVHTIKYWAKEETELEREAKSFWPHIFISLLSGANISGINYIQS